MDECSIQRFDNIFQVPLYEPLEIFPTFQIEARPFKWFVQLKIKFIHHPSFDS